MKVCIVGGAGYVGSSLVSVLMNAGHEVAVYDLLIFGYEGIPKTERGFTVYRGDIRDTEKFYNTLSWFKPETVIHLACISNDPSFELEPELGKSINYDCFAATVKACKDAGVRRFIYASSSSVYGVSNESQVYEDHILSPLTDYSRFKARCEAVLKSLSTDRGFEYVILRPATVCGASQRMRFDLVVNIFAQQAIKKKEITVTGGSQMRPNIHIDDMTWAYKQVLESPSAKVAGKIFNVGSSNLSVESIARVVCSALEEHSPEIGKIKLSFSPTNDLRSYHVNSDRFMKVFGEFPFKSYTVHKAAQDICTQFKAGRWADSLENDNYYNVRRLKKWLEQQRCAHEWAGEMDDYPEFCSKCGVREMDLT